MMYDVLLSLFQVALEYKSDFSFLMIFVHIKVIFILGCLLLKSPMPVQTNEHMDIAARKHTLNVLIRSSLKSAIILTNFPSRHALFAVRKNIT